MNPANFAADLKDGSVDPTFDSGAGARQSSGALGSVMGVAASWDGILYIGGDYATFSGAARPNITRLQADGSVDLTFNTGSGPDGAVQVIVVQPDGKILIGGTFQSVDGHSSPRVARLNNDGSVDRGFATTFAIQEVRRMAVQTDGKILVGGSHLLRLESGGTLDSSFPVRELAGPGPFSAAGVRGLALQADDKIVVGVTGRTVLERPVVRLNPDGTVDPSFNIGSMNPSADFYMIQDLAIMNGMILVGGRLQEVERERFPALARVNMDGSLNRTLIPLHTFACCGPAEPPHTDAIVIQQNYKIILAGSFWDHTGRAHLPPIIRLNPDGSLDNSFENSSRISAQAMALDGRGLVIVSGPKVIRLYLRPLDAPPVISTHPESKIVAAGDAVEFSVEAPSSGELSYQWHFNGQIIPGARDWKLSLSKVQIHQAGLYTVVISNQIGTVTSKPASLTVMSVPAGWPDPSFSSRSGMDGIVHALAVQADGKLLVGGIFNSPDGKPGAGVLRYEPNGTRDLGFGGTNSAIQVQETNGYVKSIVVQNDGKLLVGGRFSQFNGVIRNGLVRLNPDGIVDHSFQAPTNSLIVHSIALQANGKVIVGGRFHYTDDPVSYKDLVRLNADGSLDRSLNRYFAPSDGTFGPRTSGDIYHVAVQPDGGILAAGHFEISSFGPDFLSLVRYHADGSQDNAFKPGLGFSAPGDPNPIIPEVRRIRVQKDGKILVAGNFARVGTVKTASLVRLNSDGTLDGTFTPSQSLVEGITDVLVQDNGNVLITRTSEDRSKAIHRLHGDGSVDPTLNIGRGPDGEVNVAAFSANGDIFVGGISLK